MPVAVNASPSPSSGGGPPRTTATSRRGGRTRSRSPPTMGRPLGGGSPFPPSSVVVLGNGGGGENPSSAAAAAAAAAKAYSNGPPPTTSGGGAGGRLPPTHSAWPESSARDDPPAAGYHNGYDKQQQHYHHHQQGPPPPHPPQSGSHNWPTGPEDAAARSSYRYQNEYPQGYTSNVRYRDDRYHHDGRYRDMPREQYYDERGQPLPPTPHHHPHHRPSRHSGPYPVDYRYSHHGRGGVRSNALNMGHRPPPQPHGGGTSLVIGGATPIHIPKVSLVANEHEHRGMVERTESRTSSRHSRRGTAESVFRGRPGDAAAPSSSAEMVDSPQKLLLSLRTPSASFEEKDGAKKSAAFAEKAGELLPENRSPEDSKHSGSIETAQSYSLFNQSFDSFGEGNIFNIDSTLQNDSFGMGRIASVDAEAATQILHATSGNFAQQLLTANSGGLTLSYSPVNSFGNVSAVANGQSRRTGTTMVVGGGDPSHPATQELVYQSYSINNGSRTGPLDDSHLRMSVGSFGLGATSLPYSRSYGEAPPSGPSSYGYAAIRGQENADGTLVFYEFLAKYKSAFKDCEFLLPGLKSALLESPISGKEGSTNPVTIEAETANTEPAVPYGEPSPQDIALARRRVESSIFAFGGNPHSRDNVQSKGNGENSIFRGTNNDDPDKQTSATITPGSTTSTNDARHADCRAKSRYEEELPRRYYENQSRLSWEFEETPPVEISLETDESDEYAEDDPDSPHRGQTTAEGNDFRNSDEANGNISGGDQRLNSAPSSPQPKMRYRCKLCGQPKQNHTCPYQQSLARSIGVMVFPSVNAFTADEPGSLAPPLTEMNNFFDAREPGSNDSTPSRPSPDRMRSRLPPVGPVTSTTQVTPESMRSSPRSNLHSPTPSFATTPAQTPLRHTTPSRSAMSTGSRKRSYATLNGTPEATDLLFMEPMELKVDQFRVVTPSKVLNATDAFCYPSLPLPYAQRKRLSDNLYALSSEVPRLTDECALVLREAREKDMWDLAVAELMTQVIVIIHCPDGDARFDGLRQYLLTLGIAC